MIDYKGLTPNEIEWSKKLTKSDNVFFYIALNDLRLVCDNSFYTCDMDIFVFSNIDFLIDETIHFETKRSKLLYLYYQVVSLPKYIINKIRYGGQSNN